MRMFLQILLRFSSCPHYSTIPQSNNGPCHVSEIFLPLRVNSLPLATIYEVKIPLRKWKNSLLQRNPAQMTWHNFIRDCKIRLLGQKIFKILKDHFFLPRSVIFQSIMKLFGCGIVE
jgi:hypothetical protein